MALIGIGHREVFGLVIEVGVGLGIGESIGVVNIGGDALGFQVINQFFALRHPEAVDVKDVRTAGTDFGAGDLGDVGQELIEFQRMLVAGFVPVFNILELDAENGGLKSVQAAVYAFYFVDVFFLRAVVSEQAGAADKIIIVGDDGATIAVSAEVFAWIEAKSAGQAEGAGFLAVEGGKMGLSAVFYHHQVVALADGFDFVYSGWLSVEMHRDYSLGFRSDFFFKFIRVQMIIFVVINEDRAGAGLSYGFGGGDKSVGGGNDFVTRSDSGRFKADVNGVSPVGTTDTVFDAVLGGESLFEGVYILAADKSCVVKDRLDSGINL